MLPVYVKLFNIIFDKSIVPDSWALGEILPIFKNKGNPKLAENYRPITLLSCFGKVFTSILNNRLNKYAESYELINSCQAGFRKGYSAVDNLFVIQSLIDILKSSKRKLFCAFIDFKQAFDTVRRGGLWKKLIDYNIDGKCFSFIKKMYENIKSRIMTSEGTSAYFPCCTGVRQGENLSPFLFSIYLNDLERYLLSNNITGVTCEVNDEFIYVYLKLYILLYADDTVLFSNSKDDLQQTLDVFERYCDDWKLSVNVAKSKVLIFTASRYAENTRFYFKQSELETVTEYKYLGIYLTKSGSYQTCKKHIVDQANTAMFSLLRKIRLLALPIEIQIELFNKTIKPILLYACEIWGFGNLDIIERVQLKFLKLILNLKRSTPSFMVYGEVGVRPLYIDIQARIIAFWSKLKNGMTNHKVSSIVYECIRSLYEQGKCKSAWIANVKHIIESNGYGNIWYAPENINDKWLILSIKQKINDQYLQHWNSLVQVSSSALNYRIFKEHFDMNNYFKFFSNRQCKILTAFRTRNQITS